MLFSSAETSFSATQNRSKKMANKTEKNATNAMNAVNVSAVVNDLIHKNYGYSIRQENKPQHN